MAKFIHINQADNVAVAVSDVAAGEAFVAGGRTLNTVSAIPAGDKGALQDVPEGGTVIK